MSTTDDAVIIGGVAALAWALRSRPAGSLNTAQVNTNNSLENMAIQAAYAAGCSARTFLAILDTEHGSRDWDPNAINLGSGDAGRGGAWGLGQITLVTALGLEVPALQDRWRTLTLEKRLAPPDRAPATLLDPRLNLDFSAALVSELETRFRTNGSSNDDLPYDVASGYNSGKPRLYAPASTRTVYLPRFTTYYAARGDVT